MSLNRGVFILVNGDVDEKELKSFIKQKRLKKKKKKALKIAKNTSVSSSPASSSPPDSDTASVTSVSSMTFPFLSQEGNQPANSQFKRKLSEAVGGDPENRTSSDKKQRTVCTEKSDSQCALSNNVFNQESVTAKICPVPSAWHSVNSSHYIFSSDEEESDDSSTNSKAKSLLKTAFSTNKKTSNSIVSQKTKSSDLVSQNRPYPICQGDQTSAKNCGSGRQCLTSCKSCTVYSMPVLSTQETSETKCYLALDCEFVGVGPRLKNALGRCSIVDYQGNIVFDQFVKPSERVTDYRTRWSGLRPKHIRSGIPFVAAQEKIAAIIKDKVVIGHAVYNDFRVLDIRHPPHLIRDTSGCKLLRTMADLPGNACALKKLSAALLGRTIQKKEHCSVTDARASLDLFRLVRTQWEPILQAKFKRRAEGHSEDPKNSVDNSDNEPKLNSFFNDRYWPDDMFKDDV